MKKTLFAAAFSFAIATQAIAAAPTGCTDRLTHLSNKLALTDDQIENFQEVMSAQHEKRIAIHEQYRSTREAERSEMDTLHEETLSLLENVLSEQQLTAFEQQIERKRRHHERRRVIDDFGDKSRIECKPDSIESGVNERN